MVEYCKQKLESCWRYMKKNPLVTAGVIGGLIALIIVTCGAALIPAAFAVLAAIGVWAGGLMVSVITGKIISQYCVCGNREEDEEEGVGPLAYVGGLGAGIAAFVLISTSPVTAVICSVIAAVVIFTAICAGIASLIKDYIDKRTYYSHLVSSIVNSRDVSITARHSYQRLPVAFLLAQQNKVATNPIAVPMTEFKSAVVLAPVPDNNLLDQRPRRNAIYYK